MDNAVLRRLDLETRPFHEAADAGWLALLDPRITRSDYQRQLVSVYGFEGPLEAALAYTPNVKLFIDLRERSRAGLIVKDLLALGLRAGELSTLPQCLLAPFSSPIEALGWMYVAERSTLVHARVARHIHAALPDGAWTTSYLEAYGDDVEAHWQAFGDALERAIRSDARFSDVVAAAQSGFRTLAEWSQHTRQYARGA